MYAASFSCHGPRPYPAGQHPGEIRHRIPPHFVRDNCPSILQIKAVLTPGNCSRFSVELRTLKLWDFAGSSRKGYPKQRKSRLPISWAPGGKVISVFRFPGVGLQQFPLTTSTSCLPTFIFGFHLKPAFPGALHFRFLLIWHDRNRRLTS
jgi:hypothetical protein